MFDVQLDTPIDRLEQELISCEQLIARARTRQAELLRTLDGVEAHRADGAASLQEWTRARLDVDDATAQSLVTAARTLMDQPQLRELAATQNMSFDRLVATAKLVASGADSATISRSLGHDLNGVSRLTAQRRRISRSEESATFRDRYLSLQPSLDRSRVRLGGELIGVDSTVFEQAIRQRADEFKGQPGPRVALPQRMADALVSIAHDALDNDCSTTPMSSTNEGRLRPLVTVLIDGAIAGPTHGEAGAEVAYGPRVGPNTLEAMLCDGAVRVVGLADGRPITTSNTTDAIPPAVRDFVQWRDGGCVADGCTSRYRLQVHHIRHRVDNGDHDPDNLATLCWFHHHIVIHGLGYELAPDSPPQRRRFTLPWRRSGPDPP